MIGIGVPPRLRQGTLGGRRQRNLCSVQCVIVAYFEHIEQFLTNLINHVGLLDAVALRGRCGTPFAVPNQRHMHTKLEITSLQEFLHAFWSARHQVWLESPRFHQGEVLERLVDDVIGGGVRGHRIGRIQLCRHQREEEDSCKASYESGYDETRREESYKKRWGNRPSALIFLLEGKKDRVVSAPGGRHPWHMVSHHELGQLLDGDLSPARMTPFEMRFKFRSDIIAQRSINCISGILPDALTVHFTPQKTWKTRMLGFLPCNTSRL